MQFYIEITTGGAVNSSGNPAFAPVPRFVEAQTQTFVFAFLDGGQPVAADFFNAEFYLTGATAFGVSSPCFRAQGVADAAAGTVSFAVDTYTQQYLSSVLLPDTNMFVDISRQAATDVREMRIAALCCPADPRVYIEGLPPAPISNYYTADQINALLANYAAVQSTVTNSTATTATIANLAANTRYVFTQPLTSLTVGTVTDSALESEIQFTAGDSIAVDFPVSLGMIGIDDTADEPAFEAGKSYIINVKNNIAVAAEYTPGVTA